MRLRVCGNRWPRITSADLPLADAASRRRAVRQRPLALCLDRSRVRAASLDGKLEALATAAWDRRVVRSRRRAAAGHLIVGLRNLVWVPPTVLRKTPVREALRNPEAAMASVRLRRLRAANPARRLMETPSEGAAAAIGTAHRRVLLGRVCHLGARDAATPTLMGVARQDRRHVRSSTCGSRSRMDRLTEGTELRGLRAMAGHEAIQAMVDRGPAIARHAARRVTADRIVAAVVM